MTLQAQGTDNMYRTDQVDGILIDACRIVVIRSGILIMIPSSNVHGEKLKWFGLLR